MKYVAIFLSIVVLISCLLVTSYAVDSSWPFLNVEYEEGNTGVFPKGTIVYDGWYRPDVGVEIHIGSSIYKSSSDDGLDIIVGYYQTDSNDPSTRHIVLGSKGNPYYVWKRAYIDGFGNLTNTSGTSRITGNTYYPSNDRTRPIVYNNELIPYDVNDPRNTVTPNTDPQFIYSNLDTLLNDMSLCLYDQPNPNPLPSPSAMHTLQTSLPAGNVAVIELGSGQIAYSLKTASTEALPSPANIGGARVSYASTMPTTVSSSTGNLIQWTGYGGTNLFGWYMTWESTGDALIEAPVDTKYMIVVNPLYGPTGTSGTVANARIEINVQSVINCWIYPLDTNITQNGFIGNDNGTEYTGVYDPDTDTWHYEDDDGNVVVPSVGGGNISNTTDTIFDFLENIANQISGFFQGAIGAIRTLANAISAFVDIFIQLYIWLPPQVLGILTSAIILAITIGVIKVFI